MKKIICTFTLAISLGAQAGITNYTNTFPSAARVAEFVSVGETSTSLGWATMLYDYNDGDLTQSLPYSQGMEITGDGLLNDTGINFNVQDGVQGNEAIGYTLQGTLDDGETITFSGSLNAGSSYTWAIVQIVDLTAGETVLAALPSTRIWNKSAVDYEPYDFSLDYTATSETAGHQVQIQIVEDANRSDRDILVDNVTVTSIPEPATMALLGISAFGLFVLRRFRI